MSDSISAEEQLGVSVEELKAAFPDRRDPRQPDPSDTPERREGERHHQPRGAGSRTPSWPAGERLGHITASELRGLHPWGIITRDGEELGFTIQKTATPLGSSFRVTVRKLEPIGQSIMEGELRYLAGIAQGVEKSDSSPADLELERDPWKHRSKGMKCASCMWFVKKAPSQLEAPARRELGQGEVGRCRRHAPSMGGYPVVFTTDWCGDHRLDETKR